MNYLSTWLERITSLKNIKHPHPKVPHSIPHTYHSVKEEILPYIQHIPKDTHSILDIGCATGVHLREIKKHYPHIHGTGVDLSTHNIKIAQEKAQAGLSFYNADYISFQTNPVDVIIAHGVFKDIPVHDSLLYSKISQDLKEGGYILFSIPCESLYNYTLHVLRHMLRLFPRKWVLNIVLEIKKRMNPGVSEEVLRSRVMYLYVPTYRMMGKRMHKQFLAHNLHFVQSINFSYDLTSKYKYILAIYKKQKNPDQ